MSLWLSLTSKSLWFIDHSWIKNEAPDKPIDNVVLSRLKQFRAMNKLKKLALKVREVAKTNLEIYHSLLL